MSPNEDEYAITLRCLVCHQDVRTIPSNTTNLLALLDRERADHKHSTRHRQRIARLERKLTIQRSRP